MANTVVFRVPVGAVTIAADLTSPIGLVPKGRVVKVSYIATAAIAGAASPASRTFTLYNRGQAGAGTTVIATLAMVAGVNCVANAPKPITLSATPANLVTADNDVLDWESLAVTGAGGLVDPGGIVEIEIAPALR